MTLKNFYLISKETGILFSNYKKKAMLLSDEIPHSVDEIVVWKVGTKKKRRVTTFRNANGGLVERIYDYPQKPLKNIVYTHNDYVIGDNEYVKSTVRNYYSISRANIGIYKEMQELLSILGNKTGLWSHNKIETNYLAENINTDKKILSRTSMVNMEDIGKQVHRFVEFPQIVCGKVEDNIKKLLYFEVDYFKGNVVRDSIFSDGIKFSKNDKFLQFRAFDIDGLKKALTKKFMKDRNVDKLGVVINTKYVPTDKKEKNRMAACFIPNNGSVNFNMLYKHKSKDSLVGIIRHEVEHIWHYLLDARNGGNEDWTWQGKMFKKFGPIYNKELQAEANKCTNAIENYVEFTKDYQEYLKNYIEAEARRVGEAAEEEYRKQGKMLRKSLSHIPKELL